MIKPIITLLFFTSLIIGCGQKENKNLVNAKNLIAEGKYQDAKKEIQLALSKEGKNPESLCISEVLAVKDKKSATDWQATIEKVLRYIEPLNKDIKELEKLDKEVGLDDDELERLETLIRQRNSGIGFLARSIDDASQKGEPWVQELMNNSASLLVSAMLEAGKSFEPVTRESAERVILKMGTLPSGAGVGVAIDPLIAELKNPDADIRSQAVLFLGKLFASLTNDFVLWKTERAIAPISELLKNKSEDLPVIYNAVVALEMIVEGQEGKEARGQEGRNNNPAILPSSHLASPIEPLILALKTKSAQARMHAAILLGKLKVQKDNPLTPFTKGDAIPNLIMLLADNNTYVQTTAINVLTSYGQPAVEPLLEVLRQSGKNVIPDEPGDITKEEAYIANAYIDEDKLKARRISVQVAAITALGKIKAEAAIEPLINLLDNDDLKASAATALTTMGSLAVDDLTITIEGMRTEASSEELRAQAASILGNINDLRAVNSLISVVGYELNDDNKDVRANAIESLGKMKVRGENFTPLLPSREKKQGISITGSNGVSVVKALAEILAKATDDKTRNNAVVALGNIAQYEAEAAKELIKIASDIYERESLRQAAITALAAIKPPEATDAMIKIMLGDDESDVVRKGAVTVLSEIKPRKAMPPMLWLLSGRYDEPKDFLRHLKSEYRTVENLNAEIEKLGVDWHPDYKNLIEVKPVPSLVRSEVAVAFGKIKNTIEGYDVVEPLIKALKDDQRAVVRQKAAWSLGEIVNPQDKIVPALEDALRHDDLGIVRSEAATALGKIKGEKVVDVLVHALKNDKYETARKNAAVALDEVVFEDAASGLVDVLKDQVGKEEEKRETESVLDAIAASLIKEGEAVANKPMVSKALLPAMKSEDETIRKRAFYAFGTIAEPSKVDEMITALKDKSVIVRERAAALLGNFKRRSAVDPLIKMLTDKTEWKSVRARAADSLGVLRDERALQPLLDALKDENVEVRASAAAALGNLKDIRAVEPLLEIVNNPLISPPLSKETGGISEYVFSAEGQLYSPVRNNAIAALGKIGDKRAEPVLIKIVQDEIGIPQRTAITALGNLASQNAVPTLIEILQNRQADPTARKNTAVALGEIEDGHAAKPLEERLLDKTEYNITVIDAVKHNTFWQVVAEAIAKSFTISPDATDKLISRLTDTWEHDPVRIAAAASLGKIGTDKAISQLKDTLAKDSVEGVRLAAGLAVGKSKRKDLAPILVKVMKDTAKAAGDRRGATQGLGEIADPSTVPDLVGIMQDTTVAIEIRQDAAISLGKIGNSAAVSALIEEIRKKDINKNLKLDIINALGTAKSQVAIAELKSMIDDEDADVHFTAADYLFQTTGNGYGYERAGG
jgi:HEAT repeat protein